MTSPPEGATAAPVVRLRDVRQTYGHVTALDGVSLDVAQGEMLGLIGPDGVGKSTLLGLTAGVRRIQTGSVGVLAGDMRHRHHRAAVCHRIAYMPQGLGHNLYVELSVAENIRFFGRLFAVPPATLELHMTELLAATGLAPFADRPAGKLSGGMKQKLGLCCALVHEPELLILDEPTTGVDPLSRQQFWELLALMRRRAPGVTCMVATSYMDEAEQFDRLVMMDAGHVLAKGAPAALEERTGTRSLDAAYVEMLPEVRRRGHEPFSVGPRMTADRTPAVATRGLTRRFRDFTAVDSVSFSIERGEIFGFVGPNGSGKTTTMKMITGLLPMTEGEARLFGHPVRYGRRSLRRRIGYMSQGFSLYSELSVEQNLLLHGNLYGLDPDAIADRVAEQVEHFGLAPVLHERTERLPLGIRQRLSLAVATIHRPDLLVLDEPTSGVDPVARDLFWRLIAELSRRKGTTIFVSTHYLGEAARCDRVALMNAGRILACESPDALMDAQGADTLEEAFIGFIRSDLAASGTAGAPLPGETVPSVPAQGRHMSAAPPTPSILDPGRLWAVAVRESLQIWRDPFRMFSAFLVPVMLMLVFGFGLSLDIERLPYAAFDQDHTPESRAYLEHYAASRYFSQRPPATSDAQLDRRFGRGEIRLAIEIPAGFGRDLRRGNGPEIGIWIEGTMPFRAETARGYVEMLNETYLRDLAAEEGMPPSEAGPVRIETRYWYNQSVESKYAFVPGLLAFVLMLIPAMLTAVAVVREKELGSITNLYATPVTRLEYLVGKQLPYAAITYANFLLLAFLVVTLFGVPLRGSVAALLLGAAPYAFASTGIGILVSTFTRTQVAGAVVTMILTMIPSFQYSGLLSPVSGLTDGSYLFGILFPTTYFLNITVGAFTKALGFLALVPEYVALLAFVVVLTVVSTVALRKQEA